MSASTFDNIDVIALENDSAERQQYRTLLEELRHDPPAQVLVVSDLHLGRGLLADGSMTSAENFFCDEAFARLLLWGRSQQGETPPGLLVLLGDIVDFVRHDIAPDDDTMDTDDLLLWHRRLKEIKIASSAQELADSISSVERDYGLRTDPLKSVYKLADIARGHPAFFEALAKWLAAGGQVLVIRGNHDVEWHWLTVRRAFRQEVARWNGVAWDHPSIARGIVFADDIAVTLGNLYLEHGNQFDPMTEVPEDPVLPRLKYELALPLGSFVNRYLINQVERLDPFLDNVRPVNSAVLAVMKRHPIRSLGILVRGWRLLLRALKMRRYARALMVLGWMALVLLPFVTIAVIIGYIVSPTIAEFINRVIPRGQLPLGLSGVAGPYILGALGELWKEINPGQPLHDKVYLKRKAVIDQLPGTTQYIVMGHTHDRATRTVRRKGDVRVVYLNTGTWTPLWSDRRPDLIGRVLHPVVCFSADCATYRHDYWEWDDARNGVVPPVLIEDV